MSNLGLYQVLTTVAKRVGGPAPLIGIVAGSGIVLGASGMALYYKVHNNETKKNELFSSDVVEIRRIHRSTKDQ